MSKFDEYKAHLEEVLPDGAVVGYVGRLDRWLPKEEKTDAAVVVLKADRPGPVHGVAEIIPIQDFRDAQFPDDFEALDRTYVFPLLPALLEET